MSLTESQSAKVNGLSAASKVPNLGKGDRWKDYILVKALAFFPQYRKRHNIMQYNGISKPGADISLRLRCRFSGTRGG